MPNAHFSTGKKIAFTAVMFLYINLVLTIFWILKPLKKSLFIGQYDGESTFKLPEVLRNFFDLLDLLLDKISPVLVLQLGSIEMLGSSAELLAKGMNLLIAFLLVVFLTMATRLAKRQPAKNRSTGNTICPLPRRPTFSGSKSTPEVMSLPMGFTRRSLPALAR